VRLTHHFGAETLYEGLPEQDINKRKCPYPFVAAVPARLPLAVPFSLTFVVFLAPSDRRRRLLIAIDMIANNHLVFLNIFLY
jgi:hypothetical protein